MKIVCFKWNHTGGYKLPSLNAIGQYTAQHVNNLYRSVQKHTTIPHEFICITDDPEGIECRTIPLWDKCRELGGCYNRLYVFSSDMKELIGDRFLCIDLDCVVTGSLDELLSRDEDFIINKFYGVAKEQYYNGGLFMMDAGARSEVWDRFEQDIEGALEVMGERKKKREILGTDQAWISHVLGRGEALFDDEEDGVMAYYRLRNSRDGVGKELPDKACMVLFAGQIDPSTCYHANRWIQEYWGGDLCILSDQRKDIRKAERRLQAVAQTMRAGAGMIGYVPDLLNPETLTEKVLWRKHFCRNSLMPVTADKLAVKEYLKDKVDPLSIIPTLWSGTEPKDIPFSKLPDKYIIKPTHMSGQYIVVKRGETDVTQAQIRRKCASWLKSKYGVDKHEWHYAQIPPAIIIEPLIGGDLPVDYKFQVLNGRWEWCFASTSRADNKDIHGNYDRSWKKMNMHGRAGSCPVVMEQPAKLKEMGQIAEKLAEPFDYLRVDLYEVDGCIYVGELTHFGQSGFFGFVPIDFDFTMGKKLKKYVR